MPYKIEKRPDGGIVCEYRGVVSLSDNERARQEYTDGNPENFTHIPYYISDHTKTREARHSVGDMKKLGETLNKEFWGHNDQMLVALVVPSDTFFGLARVVHAYVRHEDKFGLFRNRADAEAWVGEKLFRMAQKTV